MADKINWAGNSILVILVVSFFVGLFGGMDDSIAMTGTFLGMAIAVLIALILGISAIVHFKRSKGFIKGLIMGILIILILIPLVFLGTCVMSLGGHSARRLFVK